MQIKFVFTIKVLLFALVLKVILFGTRKCFTYFPLRFARARFSRYFQLDGPRGRDPFGQQRESERKGPLATRLMS